MRTGHSRNRAMHTTLIGLLVQVAARSSLRFFNKPFRPVSYDLFSTQGFAARAPADQSVTLWAAFGVPHSARVPEHIVSSPSFQRPCFTDPSASL
jgi:hypothetical protein